MDRKLILGLLVVLAVLYLLSQKTTSVQALKSGVQGNRSSVVNNGQSIGQHSILGQPSISAVFIDRTLCAAGSPACGTGKSLYSYGVQYNIDPAYALAFFWHESNFGKYGIAHLTKGLGNIRCTDGYACIDGFRAYASWQSGYHDWYALISWYIADLHKSTIEQIVPTYAPPGDNNDTPAYIASVVASVTTWRKEA